MCIANQTNIACLWKEASGAVSVVCQHTAWTLVSPLHLSYQDIYINECLSGISGQTNHLFRCEGIVYSIGLQSDRISSYPQEVYGTGPLTKEKRKMVFFSHTWTNMDVYLFQMWAEIKVLTSSLYWAWEGKPVAETSRSPILNTTASMMTARLRLQTFRRCSLSSPWTRT